MKIFVFLLSCLYAIACQKSEFPARDKSLQGQDAALVTDWITVHLKTIKVTTGVPHPAYSRHFAYTGLALYEVLEKGDGKHKSIALRLSGPVSWPTVPANQKLSYPAAANAAVADMLRFFYSGKASSTHSIDSLEQVWLAKYTADAQQNADIAASVAYGKAVAHAVSEWSKTDGAAVAQVPYSPRGYGYWEPTPPALAPALLPDWGKNRPILAGSLSQTQIPAPLAFSKDENSDFYQMVKDLYDQSLVLTDEQKAIANFWDDAPNGKYVSAFGHWYSILKEVLVKTHADLVTAADAYMRLGITMNDATIACWQAKFSHHYMRPVTYIRKYMGHEQWLPLIGTPPHPEFPAAHSTISASAAFALESVFGKGVAFTDHTYDQIGYSPRSYSSLEAAGAEAGLSRFYGGIHYKPSINAGSMLGKKVGGSIAQVLAKN